MDSSLTLSLTLDKELSIPGLGLSIQWCPCENLERAFIKALNAVPGTQSGFRKLYMCQ